MIFIGAGSYAASVLDKLSTSPLLVVTLPDKLGGRGMKQLIPTAVKKTALERNLELAEIKNAGELSKIIQSHKTEVIILTDIGLYIPTHVLNIAQYGIWNIHPSLLPDLRGPSPIQSALLRGYTKTGVSIIQMDKKIDHGPIIIQKQTPITITDTTQTLLKKLGAIGAQLIVKILQNPKQYLDTANAQKHSKATYTNRFTKKDAFVPLITLAPYIQILFQTFNLTHLLPKQIGKKENLQEALHIHNMIRAFNPWPVVWSQINNKRIRIYKSIYNQNTTAIVSAAIGNKVYDMKK